MALTNAEQRVAFREIKRVSDNCRVDIALLSEKRGKKGNRVDKIENDIEVMNKKIIDCDQKRDEIRQEVKSHMENKELEQRVDHLFNLIYSIKEDIKVKSKKEKKGEIEVKTLRNRRQKASALSSPAHSIPETENKRSLEPRKPKNLLGLKPRINSAFNRTMNPNQKQIRF